MPFLGSVTGSRQTGHRNLGGKAISDRQARVSVRVLSESLRFGVWPEFVPADAEIRGIEVLESGEEGRCVWIGPLRRT